MSIFNFLKMRGLAQKKIVVVDVCMRINILKNL